MAKLAKNNTSHFEDALDLSLFFLYPRATKKLFVECESYTLVKMAATFCNFESNSFKLFVELGLLLLLSSLGLLLRFGLSYILGWIIAAAAILKIKVGGKD